VLLLAIGKSKKRDGNRPKLAKTIVVEEENKVWEKKTFLCLNDVQSSFHTVLVVCKQ